MKSITNLIIQKKNKNKVNVYLDGSYFCALSLETVMKNNLKKDMIIDEKLLEQYQFETEKNDAYNLALKLISTRYKTQKELERYLIEKGYTTQVIYYVIKKLGEYNFIDDEKYVESFVSHHKQKDGVNKLKQQLLAKGIKEEIIDSALDQIVDQTDEIMLLRQKYMKNKPETKENYLKLYRYLYGKGFRSEEILKVMKEEIW